MIRVRILSQLTTLGAASLVLPVLAGCTETTQDETDATESANTEAAAGSGVLSLQGFTVNYRSTSGGDEFLRVGEKMTVAIDFLGTVQLVAGMDQDLARELRGDAQKLGIELQLVYTRGDGTTAQAAAVPVTWGPGGGGLTAGKSAEFVIPDGVKRLKLELVASYTKAGVPQKTTILERNSIGGREHVVYGAFLPNKLALFDTLGAQRRTRLVEGGAVLNGSMVTLAVTDWRLDTVIEKSSLDLQVGEQQSGGRFGPAIVPAFGVVEYEVSAAVSTDDGATFQPLVLAKNARPEVLPGAAFTRFTYEGQAPINAVAGPNLKVAFHVRAFLKVPDFGIINPRFAPGSRVLLKDVWDNNGGQNYALPIARP